MDSLSIPARWSKHATRLAIAVVVAITTSTYSVNAKLTATAAPDGITLSWTAPGDDGDVGLATQYDIRYSTSLITEGNWDAATPANSVPAPQTAGSAESFTVSGLSPSTTYYFAIRTSDEVPNWSALSNVVSASTDAEQVPPAIIADLSVLESYRYSVLLGWTAPGNDGSVGTAATYDIRYHTATITESNWDSAVQVTNEPAPSLAGTSDTCTVAGLDESTVYYFAIKTADEVPNWSGLSNVVTTATTGDQTAPGAIEDLQASSGSNQGEIDLTWTAPGDDDMTGTATLYDVRYSLQPITALNFDSAATCPELPAPLVCGEEQTHTICELNPGEMYYIAMRSIDDADNISALSNVDTAIAYYSIISDADDDENGLPDRFRLTQNYPNPFNPSTQITFDLPHTCWVSVDIFNTAGQRVKTLVDGHLPAGNHTVRFDGTGTGGQNLATGVYFYRLQAEDFLETKKMVLLK